MAAITLNEAVKVAINNGEERRAGVIATIARMSPWLSAVPFKNIAGNSYAYSQEGTLPAVAFRGVNEAYTPSPGVINNRTEALRIIGGELDFDMAINTWYGPEPRSVHETLKIKAIAATVTNKIIKGDSTSDPREFDGLQARIAVSSSNSQFINAGTTDAGDAGSLFKLDQLIGAVSGARKQLWMNKVMIQRLTQAARTSTVGGFINFTQDEFGRQITTYNGIPLVEPYPDNDGTEPLAFDETGDNLSTPGGTSATSIYCVSLGDGQFSGIQSGIMALRDLGEVDDAPVLRSRLEWYMGLVIEHPKAVARYAGISNAAWVA